MKSRGRKRSREDVKECGNCEWNTTKVDPECSACRVRCTGTGGCNEMLPACEFRSQCRNKKTEQSEPPKMTAGLWKPLCIACTRKDREKTGAECKQRQQGVQRRARLVDAIRGATLPAVTLFADAAGWEAIVRYDRDEYARKLEKRRADIKEGSLSEERKQPVSKMPAGLQAEGGRPRALWMLDNCQWGDPAMQQLLEELEVYLGPLRKAKEDARRAVADAGNALEVAALRLPDERVGRWGNALSRLGPCASPEEVPFMRFAGRWLDHAMVFPARMGPVPAAFSSDALLSWLGDVAPETLTAKWLQDGNPSAPHTSVV
ncbi:hypothetical protein WJX74_002954 [Apatococcus lobatus]|uniref:Uncharacterized protein n=1 Tax=Apatococcus lobatus TaxID=904363 RepID=A0AAW1Q288_9CHLO